MMARWYHNVLLLFWASMIPSGILSASTDEKPWFVVNEDNDHFFKCAASLMTEKGLSDYVDYICRGKVTHVFFCVNGQRTSYDSKTWEPIWAGLDEVARPDTATSPDGTHDRWAVNAKSLFDAGMDPYATWIRHCREKGVSPWVSMRMNDVHDCEVMNYFRTTSFYKRHPEYRLDPTGTNTNWFLNQLDYAHPEVREYTLAQVKEVATRWEADGMELDWMRFGHVFRLGEETKNAPILDAFMREASAAIRATGKQIAVRVPYDPDVCAEYGFNVVVWAKEGLVDVIIPAPFIRTASDMPVETWREVVTGLPVKIVPDLGCETGASGRESVATIYRGVAQSFFAQGADGVYLYNLPYKSNVLYSSDSRGKAYCGGLDIAAELYENGILPEDLKRLDVDCPTSVHDWPSSSMRNDARWDAFFAAERPRYKALQEEIDKVSVNGGGRVEVSGTVYCDGPIRLKNNVDLHFSDGAKLVFTDNPERYLPAVLSTWEGVECLNRSPLIYACGVTNVAVTGRGTIAPRIERWKDWMDGHGQSDCTAITRQLYDWCSFGTPVEERDVTQLKGSNARPQLLQFNRCKNVRLSDFRIRQSPFWCVHLFLSRDVVIRGVDIVALGHNNDGIDVEMTRDVLIEGCNFRQGDDAVVIKAGRNHDGWRLATPSENVEIRNCRVHRGNTVLAIGSEMSGGVRNVWMHDCILDGFGGSVLQIKTNERRGGFIRDVRVERIDVPGTLLFAAFVLDTDCYYQWKKFPTHKVCTTEISDIVVSDVRCDRAECRLSLTGDARHPARRITVCGLHVVQSRGKDVVKNVELTENSTNNKAEERNEKK